MSKQDSRPTLSRSRFDVYIESDLILAGMTVPFNRGFPHTRPPDPPDQVVRVGCCRAGRWANRLSRACLGNIFAISLSRYILRQDFRRELSISPNAQGQAS